MNIAFFCSTPYQILLTLNLTQTYFSNEKVDLYILNHFKDADKIKSNIEAENVNLFRKIDVVECIEFSRKFSDANSVIRQTRKTTALLNYKNLANQYYNFDDSYYDKVFFTYPDIIIQIALKVLYDRNNSIEINMFEDGTGGYSEAIMDSKWTKKLLNKITGTSKVLGYYHNYFMFKPELFEGTIEIQEIRRIPPISIKDHNLIEIINKSFGYKPSDEIKQKAIFFDQPIKDFGVGAFDEVLNLINNQLENDLIVKLHPRTEWKNDRYKKGILTYVNQRIPWEVLALNSGIEDKILISYFSTALISNKVIFNEEPILIFLYDLKEFKEINRIPEDLANLALSIKEMYKDSSRVYIPQNIKELKETIEQVSQ